MSVVRTISKQEGFSLVEVLVALFLIGIGVLAAAPMFVYAIQGNAVGADFGRAGALAVERMEILRSQDYTIHVAGGSLSTNVTGYFDSSDPEYIVRWAVRDNITPVGTKTIVVRATAVGRRVGRNKQVQLATVRGG
ncbi:MAG: prepilin-type N-terminal cleavage/methylation domain-containing protein [Acidobacteriota bacterium]|nr:prepilin-type N-terminal cleavage/methylation domain-containing protein [Acidobacteriota bacterium]MDH3784691.1 prepilin-type N-terminal cleavage/methylation domain-containing protein [Acidobacteriota bacterium]